MRWFNADGPDWIRATFWAGVRVIWADGRDV